jgi:hypothetical protein
MKLIQSEKTLTGAAAKAGMDEKTARKYRRLGRLPSEVKPEHTWRTRKDPFCEVWEEVRAKLEINPGLEAKTLFEDLQRRYPGGFSDGQLRTLQRRIKTWRALEGPRKEVYFPQVYRPGELCQSDFTYMKALRVTIQGQPFDHLIYHFVLPYSNWEAGTVCFSESFESLSEGLQNALWQLGGVSRAHQTDRLSTAVQKTDHPEEFTRRYQALMSHYGLQARTTGVCKPHEIGDVEQRHFRFKKALGQALMLRENRDFASREEYNAFLGRLFCQLNSGRQKRFSEELGVLRRLPARRLESSKRLTVRVGPGSTISVNNNTYSVDSRLIGERVQVRLYAEELEIWYAQRLIERIPRLRGKGKHRIQYRHLIDWLVRKPGAFEHYRYRQELFPTHRFRMAYDSLKRHHLPRVAAKAYLDILYLAARESETAVDDALRSLIEEECPISAQAVQQILRSGQQIEPVTRVTIAQVELSLYDGLLSGEVSR